MSATDKVFSGSVPSIYESHMVPMLFQPYAAELAARVAAEGPLHVLETACGTGAVTAELLKQLPRDSAITATDLNQAMLDVAAAKLPSGAVRMRSCDAMQLPFPPQSYDAVVCQFGVMFFPDKQVGYREARRVLKEGGTFFFSVWDALEANPVSLAVHEALAEAFPVNPPAFFRRTPFGYHNEAQIIAELTHAGFSDVVADVVALPSRAASARHVAVAMCQGTPLLGEIEQRAPGRVEDVTDLVAAALEDEFGTGPIEAPMQAIVFEARA